MNILLRVLGPSLLGLVALIMLIAVTNYNIDLMFYLTYTLLFTVIIGIVLAFVLQVITYPKSILTFVIGFVGLGILYLILWGGASNEVLASYKKFNITPSISQFVSGSITFSIWLIALCFIAWIASEILKLVR